MLNYDFRTYIAEGTEFYGMSIKNLDAMEYHERKAPFPGSLLSFLDLDTESLAPLLKKISDELWSLTLTQDKRFAQEALSELAELEKRHIYFSHLRLDWTWRIGQALALGNFSENLLRRSALLRMSEELKRMQEQIRELFSNVLDMDREQKPAMRKMADYYLSARFGSGHTRLALSSFLPGTSRRCWCQSRCMTSSTTTSGSASSVRFGCGCARTAAGISR